MSTLLLLFLGYLLIGIIWLFMGLPWLVLLCVFLPTLLLFLRGYPGPEQLGMLNDTFSFERTGQDSHLSPLTRAHLVWGYLVPALLAALLFLLLPVTAFLLTRQALSLALFATEMLFFAQLRRIIVYLYRLLRSHVSA